MLPTDVIAKWLSLIGKWALDWAQLKEPEDERTRHYLLLSLGLVSAASCVVMVGGIIPAASGYLAGLLDVRDDPAWLVQIGWVAQRAVAMLVFAPIIVGTLYGRLFAHVQDIWRRAVIATPLSIAITAIAVVVAVFTRDGKLGRGLMELGLIPIFVAVCPAYPTKIHQGARKLPASRRFRLRSKVNGKRASA